MKIIIIRKIISIIKTKIFIIMILILTIIEVIVIMIVRVIVVINVIMTIYNTNKEYNRVCKGILSLIKPVEAHPVLLVAARPMLTSQMHTYSEFATLPLGQDETQAPLNRYSESVPEIIFVVKQKGMNSLVFTEEG